MQMPTVVFTSSAFFSNQTLYDVYDFSALPSGVSPADLIGQSLLDLATPAARPAAESNLQNGKTCVHFYSSNSNRI